MTVDITTIAPAGARYEPAGADGVGRIVIDRANDSVNAIDPPLIAALLNAVDDARSARPRAIVVASAKPDNFSGGADLKLLSIWPSAAELSEGSRVMQRLCNELAGLPFTVVAALNGSALAGGFELALACDWRVAADRPDLRVGLPEIQLGLIPAAGGSQRLPRLVGLPRALDMILSSRRVNARRALRSGLVDELVHPSVLDRAARERALKFGKRRPGGGSTAVERAATNLAPARAFAFRTARERVMKETRGHYPAPLLTLDAMATGLAQGLAAGLEAEARAFGELATSAVARSLIALFFLGMRQRQAASAGLPATAAPTDIAVVGAGLMGSGIAQSAAVSGMNVRLRDVDEAALTKGLGAVRQLTEDAGRKGVVDRREAKRVIARVSGTTDWSGFARAGLVIEAVFEELALKQRVLAEIEAVVRPDAVIASNTSALPIAEIATGAKHPERVVGMHFFSPVHRMSLVEVVRHDSADPAAVARVVAAGQALGKTVIVVRDGPGFYTTRVIGTMLGEATRLLKEGARIEDVDRAMTAFGWPEGPFLLMDALGLAVARHAGDTMAAALGVSDEANVLQILVDAGLQGKRGGAGFYVYDGKKHTPNERVYAMIGAHPTQWQEDIAERLTAVFVNAAARCIDDGVLRSPAEGDLGAVLGLGFPPFLGGPFRYADTRGTALRERLADLASRHGDLYVPAKSLTDGRRFYP
ncbi:MAG TPA: 3-hydroxyacyl-CoA dehydrogenase NAD-binding domain-containing protein [Candidatus Limnocylindria bacterium]|nr:3-hydroxyacyl-CoA dehydrogenase NAD-binding domain-containing protein [Candidatus Limnocylindria bacterium]